MTNKKKGIYTITVISLIVFLTFGTIPVSAASKSNKPGKPTISTEVTETTSEHILRLLKNPNLISLVLKIQKWNRLSLRRKRWMNSENKICQNF